MSETPTVSVEISVVLPIPNQSFGCFKVGATWNNVDPSQDLKEQTDKLSKVTAQMAEQLTESVATELANLGGVAIEGVGLPTDVATLRQEFEAYRGQSVGMIKKLIEKVRSLDPNKPAQTGQDATPKAVAEKPKPKAKREPKSKE
jgi:hypothetical protein